MITQTYSHDVVFAALCIMEDLLDPMAGAPRPWSDYWEGNGVNQVREAVLELAPHAGAAWSAAYARYEAACAATAGGEKYPEDPGSFDYDFIPVWLRHCVDWDADQPCVRNPQILADKLAAEETSNG